MSTNEELILQYRQTGNSAILDTIVEQNVNLVWKAVSKTRPYLPTNGVFDSDDLFQTGCIELINCVNKYDYDRNVKFSTFAYKCMIFRMLNEVFETAYAVKVPRSIVYKFRCAALHPEKYDADVHEYIQQIHDMYMHNYRLEDIAYNDEGESSPVDELVCVEQPNDAEIQYLSNLLWEFVNKELPPQYSEILIRHYKNEETIACMSDQTGLTRQWISTMLHKAIKILREKNSLFTPDDIEKYHPHHDLIHVAIRV